jgi:DnaJ family protein A protein 5
VDRGNADADLEWAAAEGEDPEEWECVACGKTFRSEAAWDSHERSKKHLKEVERLRREMQDEEDELELAAAEENMSDSDRSAPPSRPASPAPDETEPAPASPPSSPSVLSEHTDEEPLQNPVNRSQQKKKDGKVNVEPNVPPNRAKAKRRRAAVALDHSDEQEHSTVGQSTDGLPSPAPTDGEPPITKREKRRAKEARKAADGETESQGSQSVSVLTEIL